MEPNPGAIAAQCFLEMNFETDSEILDVQAGGSGAVGEILNKSGFTRVDALIQPESPDSLSSKYRTLIKSELIPGESIPIKARTYDVAILAGVLAPGQLHVKILEQILPLVKSGGFICWLMGDPKQVQDDEYGEANFERYIATLCDKCKWISVLGYPRSVNGYVFYAMQVI